MKNLNSLKGEWHIDFTTPAYLNDGIFAITGQTGAGKTTILDAICLALYAQTPRIGIISKSSNEVMTRQTGDCFAEVVIEIDETRYRCRWGQRRAHDKPEGNLQDATHEIADADTDKILDSALKKTKLRIQAITGMDFEQFTRSILLAQGGFAAFLKAKPDERADILEKITGTDIYATISMRTFQQLRDEKAELGKLQAKLSGLQLLTPTEISDYNAELTTQRRDQQQHKTQLEVLTQHINWLTDIESLNKTIADQQAQLTHAKDAKAQFAPEASRLRAAMRALEIEADYGKLYAQRVYLKGLQQQKHAVETELPQQQAQLTAADNQVVSAQNEEQQASTQWERERPIIAQVRTLDQKLNGVRQALTDKQQQRAGVSERLSQRNTELMAKETALTELHKQQAQQQDYLSEHEQDAILANNDYGLAGFGRDAGELKKQLTSNAQRLSENKTDRAKLTDFDQALATLATQLSDNKIASNQAQERIAQFEVKRQALLAGKSPNQHHQHLAHLSSQRQLLDTINSHYQQALSLTENITKSTTNIDPLTATSTQYSQENAQLETAIASLQQQKRAQQEHLETLQALAQLQDYFLALQDGKPCALCGSTSHPYHDNPPAEFAQVLQAASLGQDISKHEQMQRVIQAITTLEQDIDMQNAALRRTQEQHIRAQSELQSLQQQIENLYEQRNTAQTESHNAINQLRIEVDSSSFKDINYAVDNKGIDKGNDFKILNQSSVLESDDTNQLSYPLLTALLADLKEDRNSLTLITADIHKRLEDWEKLEGEMNTQQLGLKQIQEQQVQLKQEQISSQAECSIVQQRIDSQQQAFTATVNEINTLQTQMATLLEPLNPLDSLSLSLSLGLVLPNQLLDSVKQQQGLELEAVDACMSELKALYYALQDKLTAWTQAHEGLNLASQKSDVLSAARDSLAHQVTELTEQLTELDNNISTEQQHRDTLTEDRNHLSKEPDIDARAQQLQDAVKQANDILAQTRQQADNARHKLQYTHNSLDKLVIDIKNIEAQLQLLNDKFVQILSEQNFTDESSFTAARLDKFERDALLQRDKLLNDNVSQLQTRIDDNQATLHQKTINHKTMNHKSSHEFEDQTLDILKRQQQDKQQAYDNIGLQIGGLQQVLSDHNANQKSHTEQLRAIDEQQQNSQIWEQLNQLIGQSDGKKYRTFAQGLTFQVMISHANLQLQKMSDRYLLIHDDSNALELNVIDNYQGGDIRSTKNLSGGEGFIISLALALGLSQMASHNIRVDSLFLDEGFGTLDEESLDIALDTLTSLQQEGKLIGIISHVQALKERIMTQIQVKKISGGFSEITGQGCHKIAS
ncbi:AAA family ATPase [Psychrobacter sp. LV10R520-6]|uniref:AAA family ATPase n=1 Tax=Psychrobacter sp. LV10R520-6 TaxID=1415574 RepID=UPI002AA0AEF5|nr:AAA family ATPase [Psychrobacter sp. LV10R520-6]